MLKKLLGITLVLALVLVRWKWDTVKALVQSLFDTEWIYEIRSATTKSSTPEPTATDHTPEESVYVTSSGTRYHQQDCRSLTPEARAIPLEEAKQHYSPCGRCRPPV